MLYKELSAKSILWIFVIACSNIILADCFHLSFGSRLFRADGQPIIRPLECKNALNSSETGICMFSIDCMQNKGTPLSVCKHNYFVGTCCRLPDQQNLASIVYDLKETLPPNGQMTTLSMTTPVVVKNDIILSPSSQAPAITTAAPPKSGERYSLITTTTTVPLDVASTASAVVVDNGLERSVSLQPTQSNVIIDSQQLSSVLIQDDNLARFSYSVAPTTTLEATSNGIQNYNQKRPNNNVVQDLIIKQQQQNILNTTPAIQLTSSTAASNDAVMTSARDSFPNESTMIFIDRQSSSKPSSSQPLYTEDASQTTYFAEDHLRLSNITNIATNNSTNLQQQLDHNNNNQYSTTSSSLDDDKSSTQALRQSITEAKINDNYTLIGDNTHFGENQEAIEHNNTQPELSAQRQSISVIVPNEIDSFQIQSTATVMPQTSFSTKSSPSHTQTLSFNVGNISTLPADSNQYSPQPPIQPVATNTGYSELSQYGLQTAETMAPLKNNYPMQAPGPNEAPVKTETGYMSVTTTTTTTTNNNNNINDNIQTSKLPQKAPDAHRPTSMDAADSNQDREQFISRPYTESTMSSLQDSRETELYESPPSIQGLGINSLTNNNLIKYESVMPEGPVVASSTKPQANIVSMMTTPIYKLPPLQLSENLTGLAVNMKLEAPSEAFESSIVHESSAASLASKDTASIRNSSHLTNDYPQISSDIVGPLDNTKNNLLTKVTVLSNHVAPVKSQPASIQFPQTHTTQSDLFRQPIDDDKVESTIGSASTSSHIHSHQSESPYFQSTQLSPSTQAHYISPSSDPSSPIYSLISSTLLSSLTPSNAAAAASSSFTASLTTSSLPTSMTTTQSPISSSSLSNLSLMLDNINKQSNNLPSNGPGKNTTTVSSNSTMLVAIVQQQNSSSGGGGGQIINNKITNYNNHDSQRPLYNIYQPLHPATKIVASNSMTSNNLIPGFGGLPSTLLSHIPFKISSFSTGLSNYLSSAIKPASKPIITSNTAPALQFLQHLADNNHTSTSNNNNNNSHYQLGKPIAAQTTNNSGTSIRFPGQSTSTSSNDSTNFISTITTTTSTTIRPHTGLTDSSTISSVSPLVFSSQNLSSFSSSQQVTTQDPVDMLDIMGKAKLICGRTQVPMARIVGGRKSNFGQWPWMVSLRQWRKGAFLHKCGAALLNENWAITAAHCVEKVKAADLLLRLGEFDVSNQMEPYPYVEKRVKYIVSHPSFDPKTFEYDLALLRFSEPVKYQRNIVPVCVPGGNDSYVDRLATVIGWGRLYEDGPLPDVIQHVDVPIITNKDCERMYKQAGYIETIPEMFICAGVSKGGKDSCEGDSGGPLTMIDHDGRSYLVGIISWGIGCALPSQPGVYTRITAFSDWINQIVAF